MSSRTRPWLFEALANARIFACLLSDREPRVDTHWKIDSEITRLQGWAIRLAQTFGLRSAYQVRSNADRAPKGRPIPAQANGLGRQANRAMGTEALKGRSGGMHASITLQALHPSHL